MLTWSTLRIKQPVSLRVLVQDIRKRYSLLEVLWNTSYKQITLPYVLLDFYHHRLMWHRRNHLGLEDFRTPRWCCFGSCSIEDRNVEYRRTLSPPPATKENKWWAFHVRNRWEGVDHGGLHRENGDSFLCNRLWKRSKSEMGRIFDRNGYKKNHKAMKRSSLRLLSFPSVHSLHLQSPEGTIT